MGTKLKKCEFDEIEKLVPLTNFEACLKYETDSNCLLDRCKTQLLKLLPIMTRFCSDSQFAHKMLFVNCLGQ